MTDKRKPSREPACLARSRPTSVHLGIRSGSAPAARQKLAAASALGSSRPPSWNPSRMPASSASKSGRSPAISRSSATAAAVSSSAGSCQRACRRAIPEIRATSSRSASGPGRFLDAAAMIRTCVRLGIPARSSCDTDVTTVSKHPRRCIDGQLPGVARMSAPAVTVPYGHRSDPLRCRAFWHRR